MKYYLLIIMILLGGNAFAEVHRWVDENNHVHYSDQPPLDNKSTKKLSTTPEPPNVPAESGVTISTGTAEPKTLAEREAELRKAQKEKKAAAEKDAQKTAEKDANQAACTNARNHLKALQDGIRMVDFDAKGERYVLEDEQRQQRIAATQQDISKLCK